MIGVPENDLGAQAFHLIVREALDGRARPDRHEDGRFDLAMRQAQPATSCVTVSRRQRKPKIGGHTDSL
jgi:hypothetical protein